MRSATNTPLGAWPKKTLGEVCAILAGFGFPERLQGRSDGDLPFFKVGDISEAWKRGEVFLTKANHYISHTDAREIKARPLPPNTTVFAKIGAAIALNRRAILSEPSLVDNNVMGLHPNSKELDHKFLFHFVCTQKLDELSRATTVPSVRKSDIEQISIPIPPINEQHEIVAEIEKQLTRLEAGVAGLRRVQANLKRYRAAVLKAACEGKLVPTEAELVRSDGRTLPAPRPGVFFVYAIRCANDSIYIGQTQDLQKRWQEHVAGQAADWTSQHKPVLIVHHEEHSSREEAVAREKWLKTGFGRKWLRREIAAGRTRQAGYETGEQLLERILTERRQKWNEKGKYKEPARPDSANLSELPEGWTWIEVGQLTWSVKDGPHYSPKYVEVGIPFITGGNVRPSGVDFESAKRISPKLHTELSKRCKPDFGDILYTKGGTTGIARVNTYHEEFNVWVHVAVLKLVQSVDRFYVQHSLNSPFCYAQAQRFTHGIGNQDLGLTRMVHITFPLPPLAEQRRIVAEVERRLSVVEEMEAVVNANLQRATRLRQSILQRAFEGNLHNDGSQVSETATICANDLGTDTNVV